MSWLKEKQAAELLDYKPRTLRRKVKSGELKIPFTHLNHRKYKYAIKGINQVLNENATHKQ